MAGSNFQFVEVLNAASVNGEILDGDILDHVLSVPTADDGNRIAGVAAGPVPVNPAQGDAADAPTLRVSAVVGARDTEVGDVANRFHTELVPYLLVLPACQLANVQRRTKTFSTFSRPSNSICE